jgi:hypothetical protein
MGRHLRQDLSFARLRLSGRPSRRCRRLSRSPTPLAESRTRTEPIPTVMAVEHCVILCRQTLPMLWRIMVEDTTGLRGSPLRWRARPAWVGWAMPEGRASLAGDNLMMVLVWCLDCLRAGSEVGGPNLHLTGRKSDCQAMAHRRPTHRGYCSIALGQSAGLKAGRPSTGRSTMHLRNVRPCRSAKRSYPQTRQPQQPGPASSPTHQRQ